MKKNRDALNIFHKHPSFLFVRKLLQVFIILLLYPIRLLMGVVIAQVLSVQLVYFNKQEEITFVNTSIAHFDHQKLECVAKCKIFAKKNLSALLVQTHIYQKLSRSTKLQKSCFPSSEAGKFLVAHKILCF